MARLFAIAASTFALAAGGTAHAQPFDFKGIPLGISLAEFKNLPVPDGKAGHPICTDEDWAPYRKAAVKPGTYLGPSYQKNVVRCMFWQPSTLGDPANDGMAFLRLGGELDKVGEPFATRDYVFKFADDGKGTARLYGIIIRAKSEGAAGVISALKEKLGAPVLAQEGTVQNGYGAKFPSATYRWQNQDSVVELQAPTHENIGRFSIKYYYLPISKAVGEGVGELLTGTGSSPKM